MEFFGVKYVMYRGKGYRAFTEGTEHYGIELDNLEEMKEFELLDADYHRRSFAVRKVPAADCSICRAWKFYLFVEGVSYIFYLDEEKNIFSIIFWDRQEKDALRLEGIKKNSRRIKKEGEDIFKIEFPCQDEQIEFYCADYIERKIYRKMLSIDEYIFLRSGSEQDEYQRILAMQFLSKDQIGILRREGEKWIEVMPQVNMVK